MSAIFISHSSQDKDWAERIAAWLRQQGYQQLFLDSDPEDGIAAGTQWRSTIDQRLRQSQALIALCSPHYLASQWCLSELAIATQLCKHLFPLRIAPGELPSLAQPIQAIDLVNDPAEGLRRLALALSSQLHWKDRLPWDSQRPPYPGLLACQEADAAVFFGRNRELEEVNRRLRSLRQAGRSLLLVLGASGCGKSSLLRAGILPRLRLEPSSWLVLAPFRPGTDDPLDELAHSATLALRSLAEPEPPEPPRSAEALRQLFSRLRRASGQRDACVVVPIDQGEELLLDGSGDPCLAVLAELLDASDGRLLVIATLRSDYLGALQLHPSDLASRADQFLLNPMRSDAILQVIEGPATRVGLALEPGLSLRMTEDTRSGDALPLLALTLWELWNAHGAGGSLKLRHYEAFGGIDKAVERVANEALQPSMTSEVDRRALRDAFIPAMVRLGDQGFSRRPARCLELPSAALPLLDLLVKRRLLVRRGEEPHAMTLEVAHDSLLHSWPLLHGWLEESRAFLIASERLRADLEQWQAAPEREKAQWLLTPVRLRPALGWLRERPAAFTPELRDFIRASAHQRRRASIRQGAAIGAVVVLLISALIRLNPLLHARTLTLLASASGHPSLISAALQALQEHRWQEIETVGLTRLPACGARATTSSSFCESEQQTSQLLEMERAPYSLASLKTLLEQEGSQGRFGGWADTEAKDADFDNIAKRFTPGGLRLSAQMIYTKQGVGADRNNDGAISEPREAWMIPCGLLDRLADLWKKAYPTARQQSGRYCHLFGAGGFGDDPGCDQIDNSHHDQRRLSNKPLAFWLFAPHDDLVFDRYRACTAAAQTKAH